MQENTKTKTKYFSLESALVGSTEINILARNMVSDSSIRILERVASSVLKNSITDFIIKQINSENIEVLITNTKVKTIFKIKTIKI